MTLKVKRLGRIFGAEDGPDWMCSHAAYAAPLLIGADRLRIYIVARDQDNRGSVGFVDVSASDPTRCLDVSQHPCLEPGALGSFDDSGISIGSVNRIGDEIWLYYMGWNKAVNVPFRNAIGLAVCRDNKGDRFERPHKGPLLDRSRYDPFTISYPFVAPPEEKRDAWQMFYGTNRAGGDNEENMQHILTDAASDDGIDWRPSGREVVSLAPGDYGLSRPWRIDLAGRRLLFYSIRRKKYTIGVSEFDQGEGEWNRITGDLLGPSDAPWENEASCYPAVIKVEDRVLLFYNGNDYGRTGLGVAELTDG